MKKKIIFLFLTLFLFFLSGIAITLYIVNKTTSNLDALLTLHKVEIIRQDLVINVQTVQSNLFTTGTLFGKELDVIVDNVLKLQDTVYTCTECHHEPGVQSDIIDLQALTERYKESLSYFITSTADKNRVGRLQAVAADVGDRIISGSLAMALAANETLRRRTEEAQKKVARSKQILAFTLAVSLTIVLAVALYLIKSITEPVSEMLKATRKIRQGKLGYISSYKGHDEFQELMESFNDMSVSLYENNEKILAHMHRNQTILQTSTDGFVLVDEDGLILDANPALCSMAGYSQEEISMMRFIDLIEIGVLSGWEGLLDKVKQSGSLTTQINLKAKTGRVIAGEISATFAVMDNRGNFFCFIRDITERKKMEGELLKGQKLESLGVLAGGIAHDFNNLLTGIIGYVDLAMKSITSDNKMLGWLNNAKKASVRAQNLTQQLLTFSRGGEPVKNLLSIRELVEESSGFVLSGSNVKCEYEFAEDLWPVNADKGQVGQVIQNIILNGAQAMPSGGSIQVCAENVIVDESDLIPLVSGDYVKMVFADQGSGISKQDLAKIFDPYFSTKQGGNGLGLTICHSIVSKHRGTITVESKPGVGSTFSIYLPASRSAEKKSPSEQLDTEHRGTGRVLVMDDEEQVRDIVGEMLIHLGYDPDFARDGQEASELYKKAMLDGFPYRAVIMDLTIPGGMGGKEAIVKLLQVDPEVKAIVSSGYSNDPVMAEHTVYGFRGVVIKPFDMKQLGRVLHEILNG